MLRREVNPRNLHSFSPKTAEPYNLNVENQSPNYDESRITKNVAIHAKLSSILSNACKDKSLNSEERKIIKIAITTQLYISSLLSIGPVPEERKPPRVINENGEFDYVNYAVRLFGHLDEKAMEKELTVLFDLSKKCGIPRAIMNYFESRLATSPCVQEVEGKLGMQFNERIEIPCFLATLDTRETLKSLTWSERRLFKQFFVPDEQYRNAFVFSPDFKAPYAAYKVLQEIIQKLQDANIIIYDFHGDNFHRRVFQNGKEYYKTYFNSLFLDFGATCFERDALVQEHADMGHKCIAGGSFECSGRIDPDFLSWAYGNTPGGYGPVPYLEIIYALPLPSGKVYRFILKPAANFTLLEHQRLDGLDSADLKVINDLERNFLFRDPQSPQTSGARSLDFLNCFNESTVTPEVKNLLADPSAVSCSDQILKLQNTQNRLIWERLEITALAAGKPDSPGHFGNTIQPAVLTDDELRDQMERCIKIIADDPNDQRSVRFSVSGEELKEFIEKYLPEAKKALDRPELTQNQLSDLRQRGYRGPNAGYDLPFSSMLMDFGTDNWVRKQHQQFNQTGWQKKKKEFIGRSYNHRHDIYPLENLSELLKQEKGTRFTELSYLDTHPIRIGTTTDFSEISNYEQRLLEQFLQRIYSHPAANPLSANGVRGDILIDCIRCFEEDRDRLLAMKKEVGIEKGEALRLAARTMGDYAYHAKRLEYIRSIKAIDRAIEIAKAALIINARVLDFDLGTYLVKTFLHVSDYRSAKFIFVVHMDESISISPEHFSGGQRRRTHSELAQGKNVLAAGQLMLELYHGVYTDWSQWSEFNNKLEKGMPHRWKLKEMDNGTGHYLTPSDSLYYAADLILPQLRAQRIDIANAKIINRLIPGLRMHGAGNYWDIP